MARLGQLLLRVDLVTENDLARALGVQQFAGGRIGTLLLERGSVSEDDLGRMLAQQHGCEYASWKLLADIPGAVIAALPAKFAIRHAAVPYDRMEGTLRCVLRDPADLRILDELFFVTGRKIIAAVAPEVRIYQALEKYYGERRTPRFAILAEKLSRPARAAKEAVAAPPPPQFYGESAAVPAPLPEPHEIWGDGADADLSAGPPIIQTWKVPDPHGGWAGTSSPKSARLSTEIEAISWEEMPPAPSLWTPEAGGPLVRPPDVQEAPEAPPSPPSAPSVPRPAAAPRGVVPPAPAARIETPAIPTAGDFPEVSGARDRDVIADAALRSLETRFPRAAILAARADGVAGWASASANGGNQKRLKALKIPWSEPSVFLNVRLSRSFYLGPLLKLPWHEALAGALGAWPEECAVQPVLIQDKPVAFFYVESPRDGITPLDLVFLRELSAAASTGFAAAIRLKKKEI
ncbi:MAG: hypothetical protein LC796_01415 [Acidobacteria bacterium]|nr:hypothetical protein [Acidobacteriota bacterium]MCA1610468.1 hypothetical protein [Acidobacteriota bacterium]